MQANAGAVQYGYDGQNKRIWQASFINCSGDSWLNSDSISLFGIDGKMIGNYLPSANWNNTQTQFTLSFGDNQTRHLECMTVTDGVDTNRLTDMK